MSLTVSVIICCHTEERLQDIREAVVSVQRQTHPPEEIVLAVDNNSTLYERLKAELKGQAQVVLNDTAKGLSATRNAGMTAAQGDLVAFLDDDAVAEPEWLANLGSLFDEPKVVAAGGRAILLWVDGRPSWFPKDLDWTVGGSFTWLPPARAEVRNPHGHNMCFRGREALAVGGFGNYIGAVGEARRDGEEAELSLRLSARYPNSVIIYEPEARILHKVPAGRSRWSYVIRRSYQQGVSKALLERVAPAHNGRPLSTEGTYLRYLLFRALPSRLRRFWRPAALAQTAAIVLSIAAVGMGYLVGRWRS